MSGTGTQPILVVKNAEKCANLGDEQTGFNGHRRRRIPTCQRNEHCKERVATDGRVKPRVPRRENSFASRSITSAKASTGLARPSRRSRSAYRRHAAPESIYLRRPKARLPRRRARPQPEPMPWVTGHRPEG